MADRLSERVAPVELVEAIRVMRVDAPRGLGIVWIAVGITGGNLAHYLFDVGSESIMAGVGIGVGVLFGNAIWDRKFRADPTFPTGLAPIIAVTPGELIAFRVSVWTNRVGELAWRRPIADLVAAVDERALGGREVTLLFRGGAQFQIRARRWDRIEWLLPSNGGRYRGIPPRGSESPIVNDST